MRVNQSVLNKISVWTVFTVVLIGFIGFIRIGQTPSIPGGIEVMESVFWDEMNECTTGLASGLATPDGRPLLWKNRDVGNRNQEFHYVDEGGIPFISIAYRNEPNLQYYGGINAVGFALENSNSYNLDGYGGGNGWGYGDDDGEIHMLALSTCRTIDEFQAILDSTNVVGRTLNCNYGAFDAFGGAAMFETAGNEYVRVDAAEQEYGMIIRANYSYSGGGLRNRANYWGPNRHDRALATWKEAVEDNDLTVKRIYQQTIRNLAADGMDNYELPYPDYYRDYAYGFIPNGEVICRSTTRGILVAQGVREGERPDNSILWVTGGNQIGSVVTPLWVRAGSVPEEYDSENGGRICNAAQVIADWVYEFGPGGNAVNTWKLHNPEGRGYWDWSLPLENYMFNKVQRFLDSDNFNFDRLEGFQNMIASEIADSIESWRPFQRVTEVAEPVFDGNTLVLYWQDVEEDAFGRAIEPAGYNVFRSNTPFEENTTGELLGFTRHNGYTDSNPLPNGAFYRVEVVF